MAAREGAAPSPQVSKTRVLLLYYPAIYVQDTYYATGFEPAMFVYKTNEFTNFSKHILLQVSLLWLVELDSNQQDNLAKIIRENCLPAFTTITMIFSPSTNIFEKIGINSITS